MSGSKPVAVVSSQDPNYAGALAAVLKGKFDVRLQDPGEQPGTVGTAEDAEVVVLVYDAGDAFRLGSLGESVRSVATLVLGPDEPSSMIEAVEAGALGYLDRESSLKGIERGVRAVADGTAVIPPFMLGSLLHHVVERRRRETASLEQLDGLTPREREIFALAAVGLSHEGVAERLFISPATARTHLHRIFKKLDIHSKAELVGLAAA